MQTFYKFVSSYNLEYMIAYVNLFHKADSFIFPLIERVKCTTSVLGSTN